MHVRTLPALAVVLALLGCPGCGRGPDEDAGEKSCTRRGAVVARADLDADGAREAVRHITEGECAGSLVAVLDGQVARTDVRRLHLDAGDAADVVARDDGDLLLLRARPVHGMVALHVFGAVEGGLGEVLAGDRPVLPPVPVKRGSVPVRVTCTAEGGFSVVRGSAHQPPGIVLAWDVTRTTYGVRHGEAVRTGRTRVATSVPDPLLRKRRPGLFRGDVLQGCQSAVGQARVGVIGCRRPSASDRQLDQFTPPSRRAHSPAAHHARARSLATTLHDARRDVIARSTYRHVDG